LLYPVELLESAIFSFHPLRFRVPLSLKSRVVFVAVFVRDLGRLQDIARIPGARGDASGARGRVLRRTAGTVRDAAPGTRRPGIMAISTGEGLSRFTAGHRHDATDVVIFASNMALSPDICSFGIGWREIPLKVTDEINKRLRNFIELKKFRDWRIVYFSVKGALWASL